MTTEIPTIPEFYRNRKIFITGGSGFMGKVLIEKLLRSCPDLSTIYLLLRDKKRKEASTRIKEITDQALFDRLKQENPDALDKLVAVSGDVKELGLGLKEKDRRMLQEEVSVIFHSAASVRFDDPIRDAILINVRGTREVVNLALGMKNLKVMLHVSTPYCNFDKYEVHEEIYPAPGDWKTMIGVVERNVDDHLLRCFTKKILGLLPNTYTYCKALAEHLINDHRHQLPLVIVRPSIVMPTYAEPMPGWIDNINGPVGIYTAAGFGIVRTSYVRGDVCTDLVTVDTAIKSIIYLAWHRAHFSNGSTLTESWSSNATSLPVYNCCSMVRECTESDFAERVTKHAMTLPFENTMWCPKDVIFTRNRRQFYILTILLHIFPAILIDAALKIKGQKPMMVKLQRRIYIASMSLGIFGLVQTHFKNSKFLKVHEDMLDCDRKAFAYNEVVTNLFEYTRSIVAGVRLYLLKQPNSSLPRSLIRSRRLYWLHQFTKVGLCCLAVWLLGLYSKVTTAFIMLQEWSE